MTEKQHFTLTSECVCTVTDQETGEVVLDEYGDEKRSDYCFGCYEEELDVFNEFVLDEWLKRNEADRDTRIIVCSEAMNWDRVAGYASVSAKDLVNTLALNSLWSLEFTLEEKTLTAVRRSHDELGAMFVVVLDPREE